MAEDAYKRENKGEQEDQIQSKTEKTEVGSLRGGWKPVGKQGTGGRSNRWGWIVDNPG